MIPYISVTSLNTLIKYKLEGEDDLKGLYVKGEISNWKVFRGGVFFDLKDEKNSVVSCMMWANNAARLAFVPKNGDEVIIYGNISVYALKGQYKLQVFAIQQYGIGAALIAFENLKKKLAAEGFFAEDRKRPISKIPQNIGIIVGKNSAAESDLRRNIIRRWPLVNMKFYYAQVQGADAPASIIKALGEAKESDIDTLIVARGGGSNEDLSAFNDEKLVRAFASCPFPFVSAVGHEIDVTLIDYVADLRVSTPTAAAEAATPDQNEVRETLLDLEQTLSGTIEEKIRSYREKIDFLSKRQFFLKPSTIYGDAKEDVLEIKERLVKSLKKIIESDEKEIKSLKARLLSTNPDNVVKRGYSITTDDSGKPLTSIKSIKKGQKIKTKLKDGIITSEVLEGEK